MTRSPAARHFDQVVIGTSARVRAIFEYVGQIAPGLGTVLVTGESGTGKEVIARAIHQRSQRRDGPFVAVSCAVFSDSLIESELFGHERGAFTGAMSARAGRFERAFGGTHTVPIDVRVVAGTKRDLRRLVAEGKFREDLFYRLNVLTIELPPLRDRREDLPLYVTHFLTRFCERRGVPVPPVSDAVMCALSAYDWPGNVRELENLCERIAESCTCGRVRIGCLGASVLFPAGDEDAGTGAAVASPAAPRSSAAAADPADLLRLDGRPLDDVLRQIEVQCIVDALAACGGNKSRAARRLGVKRSTFGDRIQRCGLQHSEV